MWNRITGDHRDWIMLFRRLIVLGALGLSACGEQPAPQKGEMGTQGPPGPGRTRRTTGSRWAGRDLYSFCRWRMSPSLHACVPGQ